MKPLLNIAPATLLTGALSCCFLPCALAADSVPVSTPVQDGRAAAHIVEPNRASGISSPAPRKKKTHAAALQYHPVQQLTITAGEIKMLPIRGKVVRLAMGSGDILSTTTVDSNLLLIAEEAGSTSLLVWTANDVFSYRVTVVPKDLTDLRSKVELLTRGMNGVKLEQVGSELVLSGVAHRESLAQLAGALRNTPGLVFNVREDQGSAYTRSVLFRLHFVEVKKSFLEQIGVNWAKTAAGPTFGAIGRAKDTGIYSSAGQLGQGNNLLDPEPPFAAFGNEKGGLFFGLATTITSRLNLGISNGDVRVLSSPELTAKSGGKAQLRVGGEVPIPLAGPLGSTTVEFKPYGVIMNIEPQIDVNDVVTAKISTELSQIDPAVTVAGIPGFLTRTTATEVSLKGGEMVALSGLVNREMSDAIDRVPALSRIPILGRLFRSDDFRNNKTELIVLLEPEIIQPGDGMAQRLRQRGQDAIQEIDEKTQKREPRPFPETPVQQPDPLYDK